MNDFLSKMFLDSGKGSFNTDSLSDKILEDFEKTVTVHPDTVTEALVAKCDSFLEK